MTEIEPMGDLRFVPCRFDNEEDLDRKLLDAANSIKTEFHVQLRAEFQGNKGSVALKALLTQEYALAEALLRYWIARIVMARTKTGRGTKTKFRNKIIKIRQRLSELRSVMHDESAYEIFMCLSLPFGKEAAYNTLLEMQGLTASWEYQLGQAEGYLEKIRREPDTNARMRMAEELAQAMSAAGLTVSGDKKGYFKKLLDAATRTLHTGEIDSSYVVSEIAKAQRKKIEKKERS